MEATDKPVWKYDFEKQGLENKKNAGLGMKNIYISQGRMSKYSLEMPLGAKAIVSYQEEAFANSNPGTYFLKLTDISGKSWKKELPIGI